jgi:hypothetical protein
MSSLRRRLDPVDDHVVLSGFSSEEATALYLLAERWEAGERGTKEEENAALWEIARRFGPKDGTETD